MVRLIESPAIIDAAGNKKKIIKEFFGKVSSKTSEISIAVMNSPEGWVEPGQCPEFNEYTVVLKGSLKIKTRTEEFVVSEGMGILTTSYEWVQYSSPYKGGAEYIAICFPAFSPDIVHRDNV